MPRYKRYRSGRRKRKGGFRRFRRRLRRGYRRRRSGKTRISFRRMPTLDPDAIYVKLRWGTYFTVGGVVATVFYFRGNGPWDPVQALGGSQPLGFDQYAILYKRYRCFGSKIAINVHNLSPTIPCQVSITPIDTASAVAIDLLTEPFVRWKIVPVLGAGGARNLKNYFSTRKMFATNISQDDQYSSFTTGLPSIQWYWKMYFQSLNLTDYVTASGRVQITYYIKFYNRQTLNDV
ncbi:putative capsid protein [Wastewater CRESS DNA virus 2]|nr:putative capsid protein [Wastewater CRESS DNA virus 2]